MDNQNACNVLSDEEKAQIAQYLSRPAVVPLHVALVLSKVASVCAETVGDNDGLYDALAEVGLASMEPADDEDREELGDECPDEFPTVSQDVFNAIAWANAVLNPQNLMEAQEGGGGTA